MWAENDFVLPHGVQRLELQEPVQNQTYIMYHGTDRQSAQSIMTRGFKQSKDGMLGPGVYVSRDLQKASRYPLNLPEHQRVVIRMTANVGKVKKINFQGHPMQKTWHQNGFDTAWVPPMCGMVPSGLEEDCIWDPNRIQILDVIQPRISGYHGSEAMFNMSTMWAENDFVLPHGVQRLELQEPVQNQTYIMYHGTDRQSAQSIMTRGFKQSKDGMLGPGVYVSRDLQKASRYPLNLPEHQRVVIRMTANVGKVKKINFQGHPMQKTWHQNGFDTAWVPPMCGMVPSGLEEDCIWDPNRIQILDVIQPRISGYHGSEAMFNM
ncbi:uncharacterized protein [Osmerus mordax]|uniref:uncharacterized protein n=1 Tax=Osmerus mordax TaxID=8014 RepID=UPI00351018BF